MDNNENTPWRYKPDNGAASSGGANTDSESPVAAARAPKNFSWEAAEFIEHHHGSGWYGSLAATTAVLAALVYLISRDIFATVVIVVAGGIIWVYAGQKPGKAKYEITSSGLSVNDKVYSFGNYKSFTVVREGDLSSVNLFPLKRFMPPLSAYFDSKDEPKIIESIGNYLPYEHRQLDSIDRLTRRLRL